jgi:hypothetical protein
VLPRLFTATSMRRLIKWAVFILSIHIQRTCRAFLLLYRAELLSSGTSCEILGAGIVWAHRPFHVIGS